MFQPAGEKPERIHRLNPMIAFSELKKRIHLFCATFAVLTRAAFAAGPESLLIERTLMPEAAPSSFAVGFPNGVSFCYDVVRGGVSYVWRGGFVDVTSVRPNAGKAVAPVTLLGKIVYREEGFFPVRPGDPQHGAAFVFKGYRLGENAIEFRYEFGRCEVREEVAPLPDGSGLVRRFRIAGATADEPWWYVPGPRSGGELVAPRGRRDADGFRFDAAREFALEVHFGKESS